jgi:hypothetical protein
MKMAVTSRGCSCRVSIPSLTQSRTPQARKDLKEVGWTKGLELAKLLARSTGSTSIVQPGCTKPVSCRRRISGGRCRRN